VNPPVYSSLTAFLAHWRALRALDVPDSEQSTLLQQMEAAIAELSPGERDALQESRGVGDLTRHRQRAERHLIQILRQRGRLAG
jgi:alpha-ketoglutarate-dependent taurine dioxygenase